MLVFIRVCLQFNFSVILKQLLILNLLAKVSYVGLTRPLAFNIVRGSGVLKGQN